MAKKTERDLSDNAVGKWLSLEEVLRWLPMAKAEKVSQVATSSAGFLGQYRRAHGDPQDVSDAWHIKRAGFLRRHWAQVFDTDEPIWTDEGLPTRRHLALIMWAWSPEPQRLMRLQP